jgi:hypothetical protein
MQVPLLWHNTAVAVAVPCCRQFAARACDVLLLLPLHCFSRAILQSTKSASVYSCLAPPGVGYYATGLPGAFPASAGTANTSEPIAVPCPVGWFKSGYNTEECQSCGEGLLTAKEAATAADECFLPAGWGSKTSSINDALVASKCVFGTYGVAAPRYGMSPSPCQVSRPPILHCCCVFDMPTCTYGCCNPASVA